MTAPPPRSWNIAAVTANLSLGGATTFLLNLQRALASTPHRLHIISVDPDNEYAEEFGRFHTDVRTARIKHLIYEDRLSWIYKQLAEIQPNVVIACLGAEGYEMLRITPSGCTRLGLIQSDDPLPYALAQQYHLWLDAMIGVSEEIAANLRRQSQFQNTRVEAIPYGIAFEPLKERVPNTSGPLRVVYLGRFVEEQKRVSRLIELIQMLAPECFTFTLIGGGPSETALRNSLSAARNVTIRGAISNSEVAALMAQQDVLVLLSDYEGLPLSLLEAMGEGVVPVVSDLAGGIRQLVDSACGIRIAGGDVKAAAQALQELAQDRQRLACLARAASGRARTHYTAGGMANRYLSLIDENPPAPVVEWRSQQVIPVPLGVTPAWQFQGLGRQLRRIGRWLSRIAKR